MRKGWLLQKKPSSNVVAAAPPSPPLRIADPPAPSSSPSPHRDSLAGGSSSYSSSPDTADIADGGKSDADAGKLLEELRRHFSDTLLQKNHELASDVAWQIFWAHQYHQDGEDYGEDDDDVRHDLQELVERLLQANRSGEALRIARWQARKKTSRTTTTKGSVWRSWEARCSCFAEQVSQQPRRILSQKQAPPFGTLCSFVRQGLEEEGLCNMILQRLAEPLGQFLDLFHAQDGPNDFLFAKREAAEIGRSAVAFPCWENGRQAWQGGTWIPVPDDADFGDVLQKARLRTTSGGRLDCTSTEGWRILDSSCSFSTRKRMHLKTDELQFLVRDGQWIQPEAPASTAATSKHTNTHIEEKDNLVSPQADPKLLPPPHLPPPRCHSQLREGEGAGQVPIRTLLEALESLKSEPTQTPSLLKQLHLLPRQEATWSLDFLDIHIDSGSPDSSTFSVYRSDAKSRRFRYAGRIEGSENADGGGEGREGKGGGRGTGGTGGQLPELAEEKADLLFMDFKTFAELKRRCARARGTAEVATTKEPGLPELHLGGHQCGEARTRQRQQQEDNDNDDGDAAEEEKSEEEKDEEEDEKEDEEKKETLKRFGPPAASFAYYLWAVALRRCADGEGFEGCNFGAKIDEPLLEGSHWAVLEKIRDAGKWGALRQAQIFIGCENALTPCHYDLVHNVYSQIRGWKRFLLWDPIYSDCLYPYPVSHPMDRCAKPDLERPDFQKFPRLKAAHCWEAVLGPGDALVLPAGWWHHVESLTEDSISMSFWFDMARSFPSKVPSSSTSSSSSSLCSSLDRLLLAREAERFLLRAASMITTTVCDVEKQQTPSEVLRQQTCKVQAVLEDETSLPLNEMIPIVSLLYSLCLHIGPSQTRRLASSKGLLGCPARYA